MEADMADKIKLHLTLDGVTMVGAWPFIAQAMKAKDTLGPRSRSQFWMSESARASVWRSQSGVVSVHVWSKPCE